MSEARTALLGEHAADLIGLLAIGALDRLPDLLLALVVRTDREGHQLVQGHAVLGVDVEQLRRDGSQPQALLDDGDADEEGRRDLLLALALLAQRLKRPELIERMQRRALDVLGEAVLLRRPLGAHDAGDRRGAREALLLHQQFQCAIAATARRDLEHAGLGAAHVEHGPHGDALQQRAAGDVLGELLDRDAGLDPPDVRLGEHQLVEGNVARGAERDFLGCTGHLTNLRDGRREPFSRPNPSRKPAQPSSSEGRAAKADEPEKRKSGNRRDAVAASPALRESGRPVE